MSRMLENAEADSNVATTSASSRMQYIRIQASQSPSPYYRGQLYF
jgi:hypothetical protein